MDQLVVVLSYTGTLVEIERDKLDPHILNEAIFFFVDLIDCPVVSHAEDVLGGDIDLTDRLLRKSKERRKRFKRESFDALQIKIAMAHEDGRVARDFETFNKYLKRLGLQPMPPDPEYSWEELKKLKPNERLEKIAEGLRLSNNGSLKLLPGRVA